MSERLREGEVIGALSQRFMYNTVEDVPPGVNPKQLDFLYEAAMSGAFSRIHEQTAHIITEYFTTQATYRDIAKHYQISVPAVRERITRGMAKMRRVLYKAKPDLAEEDKYPLELMKKGKERLEVLRSDKSRIRSRDARINRPSSSGAQPIDIFDAKADSPR